MADIALMHHLLIALGIGLLIGAERERRKAERPASAGLRSFTIASLLGCASALTPWNWMSGVVLACITALACSAIGNAAPRRSRHHDGNRTDHHAARRLSVGAPDLAGASAVLITIILAAREPLHRFVGQMVTANEVADVLLISGATLIVLPMLPDRPMGPFRGAQPPCHLAGGHHDPWHQCGGATTRLLGARLGVPMLGLVSGFISSSATIGAMGAWVRVNPASLGRGRGSSAFNGCQLCADGRLSRLPITAPLWRQPRPLPQQPWPRLSRAAGSWWWHGARLRPNLPSSVGHSM
jgi:hypothetical protein